MSLIENMTALNARLLNLPQRFGVVQYQHPVTLTIEELLEGQLVPSYRSFPLVPNPYIAPIKPSLVGFALDDNLTLKRNDLYVKDIPLSYAEEDLKQAVWTIDGVSGFRLIQLNPGTTTYQGLLKSPID